MCSRCYSVCTHTLLGIMELDLVPHKCVEKLQQHGSTLLVIVSGQMHSSILATAPPLGTDFTLVFPKDSTKWQDEWDNGYFHVNLIA